MNGSLKAIIKMGQNPGFKRYVSKNKKVKAMKMKQDFLFETPAGFVNGERGQYIVELGPKMRFACGEKEFLATYSPDKRDDD